MFVQPPPEFQPLAPEWPSHDTKSELTCGSINPAPDPAASKVLDPRPGFSVSPAGSKVSEQAKDQGEKSQALAKAAVLLEDSQGEGPDSEKVRKIIESLVRRKQWQVAVALLDMMRREFSISESLYKQVINVCTDCGKWQEAATLLASMQKDVGKVATSSVPATVSDPPSATPPSKHAKQTKILDPVKPRKNANNMSFSFDLLLPSISAAAIGIVGWAAKEYDLIDLNLKEIVFLLTLCGLYAVSGYFQTSSSATPA
jgi:hypothetical protein